MLKQKKNSQAKLAYCEECGKLFSSLRGEKLCPQCGAKDREAKDKIKEYMRDNPNATLKEAAEATGAPVESVKRLTMEVISSKLSSNKMGESEHPCANCGKMIKSGTYCPACSAELQKKAQQNAQAMSAVTNARGDESEKPRAVKGLDEDFNQALNAKPARRRMYQSVIEGHKNR